MAIYKMTGNKEGLVEIESTSLGQEGVLERTDLQRLLRDKPDVLEKRLLIIAEEFGNWEDSNRRIDLLGLDSDGRLVVIELKRGDTGEHMDLQAIRYAAMVANMTFVQAVDTFQSYLEGRAVAGGGDDVAPDEAESQLREHLGSAEDGSQAIRSDIPRIILVSEGFSKELTTCVLWLNDSWLSTAGLDIKCVQLQLHRNGNELLLETRTLIPLPEASGYRTQIAERQREERTQRAGKPEWLSDINVFNDYIDKAEPAHQPLLRRLYETALYLQSHKLAKLDVWVNGQRDFVQIYPQLPGNGQCLVLFNSLIWRGGLGEITFLPGWRDLAPGPFDSIDELIGPGKIPNSVRYRRLSVSKTRDSLDAILETIIAAYGEANGTVEIGNGLGDAQIETPASEPLHGRTGDLG